MPHLTPKFKGALLCAAYAFAPNYYHYCGPDTKGEFGEYLKRELSDGGLVEHLTRFETLYPYLQAIAEANGLADPFDPRVVEAYWVGNECLENVHEQTLFRALTDKQQLKKRIPKNDWKWLLPKIDAKARLHHSFHVFNVFTRTGHHTVSHTVETMDECRISWGRIRSTGDGQRAKIKIQTQKLIYTDGKLTLIPHHKEVTNINEELQKRLQRGDLVSCHWGFICDRLTPTQVTRLEAYTAHHLQLANETL